ncbi:MAG: helix-turn-helix domain-containing protein [Ruminococcus sp.]|nr:helix-turn-helix domain-containing protein [Ruminococcus sp.]
MEQEYFSIKQVCARLGVSRMTLRRWIDSGKLPAYKLGRLVRIKREDLEDFEQAHLA